MTLLVELQLSDVTQPVYLYTVTEKVTAPPVVDVESEVVDVYEESIFISASGVQVVKVFPIAKLVVV